MYLLWNLKWWHFQTGSQIILLLLSSRIQLYAGLRPFNNIELDRTDFVYAFTNLSFMGLPCVQIYRELMSNPPWPRNTHSWACWIQYWASTSKKVPSDMCAQRALKPACASMQSDQSLHCPLDKTASLTIQNTSSKDSDQTARMRRLIWIFAGRTLSARRSVFWGGLKISWSVQECDGGRPVFQARLYIHNYRPENADIDLFILTWLYRWSDLGLYFSK